MSSSGTSSTGGSQGFLSTPRSNLSSASTRDYASLCKVVLARRMRNMIALSFLASYCTLLFAVFDPKELPGSMLNLFRVVLFAPLAFLGTVPLFVLRKQTITLPRPPLATKFARYSQLGDRSTLKVLLTYLSGACLFHFAYVWAASACSNDSRLGFFFYHQGRDSWQINERRITLGLFHAFLAAFATAQHVVRDRSQVHFDQDTTLSIPTRLSSKLSLRLSTCTLRSSSIAFVSFWTGYVVLRRPILRFILLHLVSPWARPHLYSIMRHSGAYSFTLALRSWVSSVMFFTIWEVTNSIFEIYATQPMSVSQFGSNPNQSLLSGLRAQDPYYQQFAFQEFSTLTLTSPSRREMIFRDVKRSSSFSNGAVGSSSNGGGGGGAWSELSRECLVLIGTELQRAKGRGRLPVTVTGLESTPASSSSSGGQTSTPNSSSSSSRSSNIKSNETVFLPSRSTFFDKVATSASSTSSSSSPSSLSPLTEKATSAITSAVSTAATRSNELLASSSRVPSILRSAPPLLSSLTSTISSSTTNEGGGGGGMELDQVPKVLGPEPKLARYLSLLVGSRWREEWFGIGEEYRIKRCVSRVSETVSAIQGLSNLTCASLTEDPYGVAQRDIPKILEGFVRYLNVLDQLEKEFETLFASRKEEEEEDCEKKGRSKAQREVEEEEWRKVEKESVGVLQQALRQGARSILTEFSPYLSEFRFPTHIATQLQLLVDWGA